jgi:hypothetical protein
MAEDPVREPARPASAGYMSQRRGARNGSIIDPAHVATRDGIRPKFVAAFGDGST